MATFRKLDRLSKTHRVKELLAFRPDLPEGHYPTFVIVVTFVDDDGEVREEVVRAGNGNIREYRDMARIEKLCHRWNLSGAFMSVLSGTSAQHRLKHLSGDDWQKLLSATAVKYVESTAHAF